MDLGLNGRTALITGADSGIGWHTAKLLLAEGAKVAITDLDSDELTHAAQALDVADDRLVALPADVTDADSLAKLHQHVKDALGPIDILVQSAGVTGAQGKFHEIDEEGWRSTLDIDLMVRCGCCASSSMTCARVAGGVSCCWPLRTASSPTTTRSPTALPRPEYWLWLRVCRGPMPVRDSSSTPFLQPSSIPR